jgi:hypothetical protein
VRGVNVLNTVESAVSDDAILGHQGRGEVIVIIVVGIRELRDLAADIEERLLVDWDDGRRGVDTEALV